jgi:hypothetical protein
MQSTGQEKVPLADAWRIATGQEFPVLTEEDRAEFQAMLAATEDYRRQNWGERPDSGT